MVTIISKLYELKPETLHSEMVLSDTINKNKFRLLYKWFKSYPRSLCTTDDQRPNTNQHRYCFNLTTYTYIHTRGCGALYKGTTQYKIVSDVGLYILHRITREENIPIWIHTSIVQLLSSYSLIPTSKQSKRKPRHKLVNYNVIMSRLI